MVGHLKFNVMVEASGLNMSVVHIVDPLTKHLVYISVCTIIQFLCIQFQLCAKYFFRALTIYMQFVFFLIFNCNLFGIASF